MANPIQVDLFDPTLPTVLEAINRIRTAVEAVQGLPLETRAAIFAYLRDLITPKAETAVAEAAEAAQAP